MAVQVEMLSKLMLLAPLCNNGTIALGEVGAETVVREELVAQVVRDHILLRDGVRILMSALVVVA